MLLFLVIGRSVGIHENIPGGPVLYCAEVRLANLSTVQLTISEPTAYNRSDGNEYGVFTLDQWL